MLYYKSKKNWIRFACAGVSKIEDPFLGTNISSSQTFRMQSSKQIIINYLRNILETRLEVILKAMEEAQLAANQEEKSSAGDKFETGRSMSQNLRDLNARQFTEAKQALIAFDKSTQNLDYKAGESGALIKTSENLYFLGPGLGKVSVPGGGDVISLSPIAPLGKLFLGKKKGQSIEFQKRKIEILEIQ